MHQTDILIIGAGAVGAAIAREFSRYRLDVTVVDKNYDVGGDATMACSSIAGTGYANPPGSLLSRLACDSHASIDRMIDELEIYANRCGQIMPAFNDEEVGVLHARVEKARANGYDDVRIVSREEALEREPILHPSVKAAIYAPREIGIDTFTLAQAQAENAASNGVTFLTSCEVTDLIVEQGRITGAETTKGTIRAKFVINAAGLYCDRIQQMAEEIDYTEHPRKGQFYLLDRNTPVKPNHIIMPVPTAHTRGKLVLPTAHGNVLVGPTAEDLADRLDHATTAEGLADIEKDIAGLVTGIRLRDAITEFAGLRPVRTPEGYHIGFSEKTEGLFNISGVRSDGVTTSVGIAHYVTELFRKNGVELKEKEHFISERKRIRKVSEMTREEQLEAVKNDPLCGRVICRCEKVTEAEIVEAIRRTPGATTVDGVKRRLRAGMGRCQGGFCMPRVIDILARELGVSPVEITKKGGGSWLITEPDR